MKINIFSNHPDKVCDIVKALELKAEDYGYEIVDENPDVVIYVGGDGTFLSAIQNNIDRLDDIYLLGIHYGGNNTLGHFYDFGPEDIDSLFPFEKREDLFVDSIPLIEAKLTNAKDPSQNVTMYATNEIKIMSINGVIKPNIYINNELLENYCGSGMVISSTVGSTGLNKSLGGPVISSNFKALCLTPIAPLTSALYNSLDSSLILSTDDDLTFNHIDNALISFDNVILDEHGDTLTIKSNVLNARVLFSERRANGISSIRKSFKL